MSEKYIITSMKRNPLSNGEEILSVIETLSGIYNSQTGLFVAENGLIYKHVADSRPESIEKASGEYYNLVKVKDLENRYPTCQNIEEIKSMYQTETEGFIYFFGTLEPGKPMLATIDIDNLKQMFIASTDPNSRTAMPSEAEETAELIAAIATGCYTEQELREIKDSSLINIEYLKSIIESVDNHLPETAPSEEINIREVFAKVKETVIDQDEAAKRLIVEIERNSNQTDGTGILITGNSGTGKTLLVETIAENIDRVFLQIDSSQLSAPGYVGKHIEQYLWELYVKSGYDIDAAEHAVVYFDEIDKKGSEKKSDVSGQAVLNQLLKFLDGTTYLACQNPQMITPETSIHISTKNMTIIAGGAFSEIYEAKTSNPIGFGSQRQQSGEPEIADFIEKAMIPKELMGRLPVIIHLNPLTIESLKKILTDSDKSVLKIQEVNFTNKGVELKVTKEYLDKVAKIAHERKIGARGLNKIIKDTTWRPYDVISFEQGTYEQVILDERTIDEPEHYQLIKRRDN